MAEDVPGTLGRVYDMGFREVELAGTYGMTAEAFKAMLDSVGLTATSMHVPYDGLKSDPAPFLEMLGGLLIGLIETFWSAYFSVEYKDVAAFCILVLVLIFRPTGLLGRPEVEKV
jgi:hypothetical protein